jgi:hypothetical protein
MKCLFISGMCSHEYRYIYGEFIKELNKLYDVHTIYLYYNIHFDDLIVSIKNMNIHFDIIILFSSSYIIYKLLPFYFVKYVIINPVLIKLEHIPYALALTYAPDIIRDMIDIIISDETYNDPNIGIYTLIFAVNTNMYIYYHKFDDTNTCKRDNTLYITCSDDVLSNVNIHHSKHIIIEGKHVLGPKQIFHIIQILRELHFSET